MYLIILSIVIAIIAGSCIFGKKFWENRFGVLLIAGSLMLVSLFVVSLSVRHTLPVERTRWSTNKVLQFYVQDSVLPSESYPMIKTAKWDMSYLDVTDVRKRIDKKRVSLGNNTYKYTYRYAKQKPTHLVMYLDGSDTVVGFIQVKEGKPEIEYFDIDEVKISALTRTISIPGISRMTTTYHTESNWLVGDVLPRVNEFRCIYIPKAEYDRIPMRIKLRCYFDNQKSYTALK